MDTEIMREFLYLAEHRNALKTAQRFHISTSTLSRHIDKLETELASPPFKSTRTYALTPEGTTTFNRLENILIEYDQLQNDLATTASQELRIAYAIEDRAVAKAVLKGRDLFIKDHPHARVSLLAPQEKSVIDTLSDGDANIAILYLPTNLDPEKFSSTLLLREPLIAAVPKGALGNKPASVPLKALDGFTFFYAAKPGYQDYTDYILGECKKKSVMLHQKRVVADNIDELYSNDAPDRVWFFTQSTFDPENRPLFQQAYDSSDLIEISDVHADRYLVYPTHTSSYLTKSFVNHMTRANQQ